MDLNPVRKELDKIDNVIKYLLVLRMSIIPIVTKIKLENDLSLVQGKREEEIYENIKTFAKNTGISGDFLKNIYELIISEAVSMEKAQSLLLREEKKDNCVIKEVSEIEHTKEIEPIRVTDEVLEKYKKLDEILASSIPQIISEILGLMPDNKLSEISTGIFERRIYEF